MLDITRFRYLIDDAPARRCVDQLCTEPVLGLDIETTGLDPYTANIRLVSVATLDGHVAVFDLQHLPIDCLTPLAQTKWAVFNGAFEYRFLTHAGLAVPALHDVQLLDRLHSHHLHRTLADAVHDALQFDLDKNEQVSDWATPQLSEQQLHYAGLDALVTVRAAAQLLPAIDRAGQRRLYNTWRAALPVLADLTLRGQAFDWAAHAALTEQWQADHDQLSHQLRQHLGAINPNSGPQLGEWLQRTLPASTLQQWPKTPKGRLKTNADSLALFADLPAIQPLLRYKAVSKLLSTYGTKYDQHRHPITGRLHPHFPIGQTVSGRLCAHKPNTQNPPRLAAFRALFIPEPGKILIGADYSQIELRVAALLSNDRAMVDAYARGDDLHTLTAAAVAGVAPEQVTTTQRQQAKAVNFGNLYGQGPAGLAQTAKLTYGVTMSAPQAQQALNQFHMTYPQLAAWKRQQVGLAQQFRQVKTQLGLIRDFDVQGNGYLKGEAQNIPVQGSAAEILHCTLARLPQALQGLDAQLYHNVHDELILQARPEDADKAAHALQDAMVQGFLEVFPHGTALTAGLVDVHTGPNWASVH